MHPASSRRVADVAPSARRRTRPPSRIGSAESLGNRKELESQYANVWRAYEETVEAMTTWVSESDELDTEMAEDIFHALGRLERRDYGKRRPGRSAAPV